MRVAGWLAWFGVIAWFCFLLHLLAFYTDKTAQKQHSGCMGRRKGQINKLTTLPRGVSKLSDGRDRPFCVRHRDLKREFFATAEAAGARKRELVELERDQGRAAIDYSRQDHALLVAAREVLPVGVSVLDAARFWVLHHPSSVERTVAGAVSEFLAAKRVAAGIGEGDPVSRHIGDLTNRCGAFVLAFGPRAVVDVTGNEVLAWLQGLRLAPRTVANYRNAVQTFFNFAVRRDWLLVSPLDKVDASDLPAVRAGAKHPLTVAQANKTLALFAKHWPRYRVHFALRFFLGFRTAEVRRFRWEWIQREQGRVIIPGWFYDGDQARQGSKTGDNWAIDDVPPRFWAVLDAVGKVPNSGEVPAPYQRLWDFKMLPAWRVEVGLREWPHNATRDTFCTLHMSAYRDDQRTALILKHSNTQQLRRSYLGTLVPQVKARVFFEGG